MIDSSDHLWPHFAPLWSDLQSVIPEKLILVGGYGLFLKQQWLQKQQDPKIAIPFTRWRDVTPRVTKDIDVHVGFEIIARQNKGKELLTVLEDNGFAVTQNPSGKRWQFEKQTETGEVIIAELHSPRPPVGTANITSDRIRVKHSPSLKSMGVHARKNLEAEGCHLDPFCIEKDGIQIALPNPKAWARMKLGATCNHRDRSNNIAKDRAYRDHSHAQAIKHAHDVCRAIAMMTPEERDVVNQSKAETDLREVVAELFASENSWGLEVLSDKWDPEDLRLVFNIFQSWYS